MHTVNTAIHDGISDILLLPPGIFNHVFNQGIYQPDTFLTFTHISAILDGIRFRNSHIRLVSSRG